MTYLRDQEYRNLTYIRDQEYRNLTYVRDQEYRNLTYIRDQEYRNLTYVRDQEYRNLTYQLEQKSQECDILKVMVGTRNEFEKDLLNSLYPARFPELKREDRYHKCVLGLYTQTGRLANKYRKLIKEANMTIPEFCHIGNDEMYPSYSLPIHLDIEIPDHCMTWDSYWKAAQKNPRLRTFLEGGQGRMEFIQIPLDLRRERTSMSSIRKYDLSMYCYSLLV